MERASRRNNKAPEGLALMGDSVEETFENFHNAFSLSMRDLKRTVGGKKSFVTFMAAIESMGGFIQRGRTSVRTLRPMMTESGLDQLEAAVETSERVLSNTIEDALIKAGPRADRSKVVHDAVDAANADPERIKAAETLFAAFDGPHYGKSKQYYHYAIYIPVASESERMRTNPTKFVHWLYIWPGVHVQRSQKSKEFTITEVDKEDFSSVLVTVPFSRPDLRKQLREVVGWPGMPTHPDDYDTELLEQVSATMYNFLKKLKFTTSINPQD